MSARRAVLGVLILVAATASPSAQRAGGATRTTGGPPDLEGFWNFNTPVPLQRPVSFAGRTTMTEAEARARQDALRRAFAAIGTLAPVEAIGLDWIDSTPRVQDLRTSLLSFPQNGRLPALVPGVRRMPGFEDLVEFLANSSAPPPAALGSLLAAFSGGARNSHADFPAFARCLFGADVPLLPQLGDNYVQIVQGPDHIVLVTDVDRRIITLDNAVGGGSAPPRWAGVSRGRWDGTTLVVETKHFDGRAPSFAGAGSSSDKVVVERFSRTSRDVIEYSAVVMDPKTFQERIEFSFPMARIEGQVYEGACHEGNYSLRHALAAARQQDEVRPAKAP